MPKEMNHQKLIILVHGTFARKADWPNANSILRTYLKDRVNMQCDFYDFRWSGSNSNNSRIGDSKKLAKLIAEKSQLYTDIAIVSHSHGGNISLYATKHLKNFTALSKIICLGTPFLIFSNKFFRRRFIFISFILFCIGLTGLLEYTNVKNYFHSSDQWMILVVFSILFLMVTRIVYSKVNKYMKYILEQLSYPDNINKKILSVQYYRYEASGLLNIVNKVLDAPIGHFSRIVKRTLKYLLIFGILFLCAMLLNVNNETKFGMIYYSMFTLVILILGLNVASLLKFAFLWPVVFGINLFKFSPIMFGFENPLFSLFCNLEVSKNLPEINLNTVEEKYGVQSKSSFSINHSQYYQDERVLKRIVEFINLE